MLSDSEYCAECTPKVYRVVETLHEMVKEWEAGMGEHDKSLYSLGLRRAIDIIENNDGGTN